ncbi:MAG TPA: hypothetical protein VKO18_05410 [Terriglobia bacterium]|nr:hypothetical protein [Terriglobia bacterium]
MALNITAILVFLIFTISLGLARYLNDPWWFGMFAVSATGVVTFFGLIRYELNESKNPRITNSVLRLAIASAVTIAYIVAVGFAMFIDQRAFQPSALSTQLVGSFTAIVGTVIAFFFGVSGYVDAQAKRQRKDEDVGS